MSTQFLILLTFVASVATTSQGTTPTNQTELQAALTDMKTKSYYGFVILLNLLNTSSIPLRNGDITFLVPDDQQLSGAAIGSDQLREFVLSHTLPSALTFNNLLRFPTGTLVPTSVPTRRISFNNNGKSGLFVNNARVVRPNMCNTTYLIKCHGISAALVF